MVTNQNKQAKLKMQEAVAKYTGPITKIPAKELKSKRNKRSRLPDRIGPE